MHLFQRIISTAHTKLQGIYAEQAREVLEIARTALACGAIAAVVVGLFLLLLVLVLLLLLHNSIINITS